MKLPKFFKVALLGLIMTGFTSAGFAITVSPSSLSVTVGSSKTVVISKVSGALSIKNSNTGVVSVTSLGGNVYRLQGVRAGKAEIVFKDKKSSAKVTSTIAAVVLPVLNGRLLASNCFQCHGTNGSGGFERLTGETASEIYQELKEFANGSEDPQSIMAAHAMGFTDAQLRAMAVYFSSLK